MTAVDLRDLFRAAPLADLAVMLDGLAEQNALRVAAHQVNTPCPHCIAKAGRKCRDRHGREVTMHDARRHAAADTWDGPTSYHIRNAARDARKLADDVDDILERTIR